MARLRVLGAALLSVFATSASAWTFTQYVSMTSDVFGLPTLINVTPTGPVSPTSTNVTTTSVNVGAGQTWIVTKTDLYVVANASVCVRGSCTSPTSTAPVTISTRFFAPVLIQNPSSCTKTSFSYTSSHQGYPALVTKFLDDPMDLSPQASNSAEALFITTHAVTLRTDLGGQAVTTSFCDVYLKPDAVQGITPGQEAGYLSECVDPSSFLCTTTTSTTGCVPGVPITYPPNGQTGGVGGAETAAAPTTTPPTTTTPTTTTSMGGVESLGVTVDRWSVLGVAALAILGLV